MAAIIIVIIILVVAVAGVSYIYFGKSSTTTSAKINLVVATLPIADSMPLLVAQQNGYFTQQGLNVTLDILGTPALVNTAVEQGSAQIGLNSPTFLMSAHEQGFNLQFIAPVDAASYPSNFVLGQYIPNVGVHAIAVLSSSGIKNWTDLEGKTIGVPAVGSAQQTNLLFMLKHFGVNSSTISWSVVPYPSGVAALVEKRVDAIATLQPFITELLMANQSGATAGQIRIIGDDYAYGSVEMITGMMASPTWANANPTIVNKFNAALKEGVQAAQSNVTLDRQMAVSQLHLNSTVASQLYFPTYWSSTMPYSAIQDQINIGLEFGTLKNASDNATQIVDTTYFALGSPSS